MSVTTSDIKFYKSALVSNTSNNGGRKGYNLVTSAKHNLFPRVSSAERASGITRYRKEFFTNLNVSGDTAYDLLLYIYELSLAADYFRLAAGSQTNVQSAITGAGINWYGGGLLHTDISAGESSLILDCDSNDLYFPNGGWVYITDGSNEEWQQIADTQHVDEEIGTGDATTTPSTDPLDYVPIEPNSVTITVLQNGTTNVMTVTDDGNGGFTGDCNISTSTIDYDTGYTSIEWDYNTEDDSTGLIEATYKTTSATWSTNQVTIALEGTFDNDYSVSSETRASGCLEAGDVECALSNWTETQAGGGSGNYNESTYPLTFDNRGCVYDTWTILFTGATTFTCSGTNEGSVGSGNTSSDFTPTNANTGFPYFTLDKDGWGGGWLSDDYVTFTTTLSAYPLWVKEIVPAACAAYTDNEVKVGYYCE